MPNSSGLNCFAISSASLAMRPLRRRSGISGITKFSNPDASMKPVDPSSPLSFSIIGFICFIDSSNISDVAPTGSASIRSAVSTSTSFCITSTSRPSTPTSIAASRARVRRYFQIASWVFSEISFHSAGVRRTAPIRNPLRSSRSLAAFRVRRISRPLDQARQYCAAVVLAARVTWDSSSGNVRRSSSQKVFRVAA